MKSLKKAFIFALLVWVVPFVVAMFVFPLRESDRAFFESIMPVAVVLATVFFSTLYFKKVDTYFLKEGILLGFIFLLVSLAIDLVLFSQGSMAMPLGDYIKDIGFTYLMIPVITIGFGFILSRKR